MTNVSYGELNPPTRILLGPGPSNVHPRVLRAMQAPLLGYLDPAFFVILDEVMALLRHVFKAEQFLALPISGTGSAGMEAAIVNLLEPGDTILVGVNGYFGERMVEMATRCGADAVRVEAEWGHIVEPDAVAAALRQHPGVKAVAVVHAETSTGALQPLVEIGRLAREYGALFIVDAVTSLSGCEVAVNEWGIDWCYSGTQKCLSCPPGLAPITVSDRAREVIQRRTHKVQSWYLDLSLIENYWGEARVYHHTPPASTIYALREALRIVVEEGLEARFARHELNAQALRAGLSALGLTLHAQEGHRLPTLTSVRVPQGVEDARVRQGLLREYGIEIGGGLGALRGKVWRIGLMGYSSSAANVLLLLSALERLLAREGHPVAPGEAVGAAGRVLHQGAA